MHAIHSVYGEGASPSSLLDLSLPICKMEVRGAASGAHRDL